MAKVFIIGQDFDDAGALADLLTRRRVDSIVIDGLGAPDTNPGKGNTLVCTAAAEQAAGGQSGLVTGARQLGITQLVIVAPGEDFSVEAELGGRMQRVTLPLRGEAQPPLYTPSLLALSDLIATPHGGMVAAAASTSALIDLAARVAQSDVTVFINGPTGSGKEVLSRLIHDRSPRAGKPFVAVNCAAIPENMLEAMLFGHEKGAFTGASTANRGIFRAADGGTLLLDEISEMPLGLQAKLLRVLQEKKVTPLGSQKEESVNIRVIATSNRDMLTEMQAGNFREDLYYRLNVFPLATEALAVRPDDIPALAVAMIRRHVGETAPLPLLSDDAMAVLRDYQWPGNVRELENVVQRALVLRTGNKVCVNDIMLTTQTAILPGMIPTAAMAARAA
ncbi:Quorum-sensing regulator protein F [Thalassovita gelatinovora]|uniref:Nif-specific regulatory protein n=1 Tax=Thalassovita gelatinovora TaxID=53501 RepID=A0A0P1FK90_THAGE|nr:sigma-54 dependent transcriptional regulator [Thalassovita gelatinovora]QIZ78976.1 sigma-54-dependent Fis family transcriptional regulator [Thalassovita gelatinovora]CUH68499.1 Quorum-sensing regulator protein F [Thalassovita gelatinovora]SEQ53550.1 two-component system, response regulator FlrC [Thalassovita gelatinovora]